MQAEQILTGSRADLSEKVGAESRADTKLLQFFCIFCRFYAIFIPLVEQKSRYSGSESRADLFNLRRLLSRVSVVCSASTSIYEDRTRKFFGGIQKVDAGSFVSQCDTIFEHFKKIVTS